ncbi:MAG: response regulator [Gemmatimonadaceae bacterium]
MTPTPPPPGATPAQKAGESTRSGDAGDPARRVLIVDDNEDAASSLGALLEIKGHRVALCHDGLGALAVAERFQPDVALLDIDLPGIDGYELAERLRAQDGTRTTVLVALSGYGSAMDRARARAAGFDHHITKPANLERLDTLIAGSRFPAQ